VSRSGSNDALGSARPKFVLATPRHSPLGARFVRSQSATKSPSESVHVRVVLLTCVLTGFGSCAMLFKPWPARYLFTLTFTAVRPVPNTSYTAPIRGVMSFQFRLSCSGNVTSRPGTSGPENRRPSPKLFLNQSNRTPPVSVSRSIVHLSWAKMPRS
jgi:hypothetical protein